MYTETLTQRLALGNGVAPQTVNNASLVSTGIDMQQSKRAFFLLALGAVVNGGSINAKLQESSDNSSFTDLAGSNVSVTGLTTANKITTFEVRTDQITKRYVRLSLTETGSQNVLVAVAAWGDEGDHKPDNAFNGTNVATQNVVS